MKQNKQQQQKKQTHKHPKGKYSIKKFYFDITA